jgi:uncharacterized protein YjdB
LLLIASCGGGGDGGSGTTIPRTPILTKLIVSIDKPSLAMGSGTFATAAGLDQNNAPIDLTTINVSWSAGSSAIADVMNAGQTAHIGAMAVGSTSIIATVGSVHGQAQLTVTPAVVDSVQIDPATADLLLGTSVALTALPLNQEHVYLAGHVVTWTSSDTSIATVTSGVVNTFAQGTVRPVAPGIATITATCEGKTATVIITVKLVPIDRVSVTPTSTTLNVGGTQQLTATPRSRLDSVLTGRVVTWTSSDVTKATVSSTGLVTAVATGTVAIAATSEGIQGSARIDIASAAPVATISVSPATKILAAGATATLTAFPLDATGHSLIGRVFTWTTSNASIATVTFKDSAAIVTGVAPGTATITATSEGQSGTATMTVFAPPTIASISPNPLVPGSTMMIAGSGFATTPTGNTVRIGSLTATVTSASATQLTATVPCLSSGIVPVTVTANTLTSVSVNATVAVNTRTLAVGEGVQLLDDASLRCNELAMTGGIYLVSVFNSSTTPSATATISIAGNSAVAASSNAMRAAPAKVLRMAAPPRTAVNTGLGAQQLREQTARAHATRLERDRALYAQTRGAMRSAPRRARSQVQALAIPVTVGSTVTINNRGLDGSCSTMSPSTARVVAVNAHSILLEDNASPTAGQVDPELMALGQIFETSQYTVEANFGDINAYDAMGALDNPGRVVMFFTPSENVAAPGGGIVLGHVTLCDFVPPTVTGAAGSNNTKIFYARVPTTVVGAVTTQDSKAWWRTVMPGTLVHESKHLTSYAEHLARDAASLEESWLEEGTAQVAAEIYSRSVYAGTGWKTNTNYASSLYCDVRRGTAACPNGQALMLNHFAWLYSYYQTNEASSFLSPGSVDGTIYGSAWMFSRWLVDQYGGATESTLLRALTQETTATGVANVTKQTGQNFTSLLADWTMMLIADDYPFFTPGAGAKFTFPSWNTRSIWSGLNADLGTGAFPLEVNEVQYGTFKLTGTLPGAAAGLIELYGGQTSKQLLDLSGLPAGTPIRVSILRVL